MVSNADHGEEVQLPSSNVPPSSFDTFPDTASAIDEVIRTLDPKSTGNTDDCPVIRLRRKRNTLLPISSLPVELLKDIIRYSMDVFTVFRLRQLASVCEHWYDVIVSTPTLWRTIDYSQPRQTNEMILKRNKRGRLDILCPRSDTKTGHTVKQFMAMAAEHCERWELISYSQTTLTSGLMNGLKYADALGSLHVAVLSASSRIHLSSSARLYSLSLYVVPLDWASSTPNLRGLTRLYLESMATLPPVAILLDALSASPELHELCITAHQNLDDFSLSYAPGEFDAQNKTPVILSNLMVLRLERLPRVLGRSLLARLRAPAVASLCLSELCSEVFNPNICEEFRSLVAPLLRWSPRIEIESTELAGHLRIKAAPPLHFADLFAAWTPYSPADTLGVSIYVIHAQRTHWDDILTTLGVAKSVPVEASCLYSEQPPEVPLDVIHPRDVLAGFPRIEKVRLVGRSRRVAAEIYHMGQKQVGEDGLAKWICPRLMQLILNPRLDSTEDKKLILDAFKIFAANRFCFEIRTPWDGEEDLSMPVKLRSVVAPYRITAVLRRRKAFDNTSVFDSDDRGSGAARDIWRLVRHPLGA